MKRYYQRPNYKRIRKVNYNAEGYDKLYKKQQRLFDVVLSVRVSTAEILSELTNTLEWAEFDKARKAANEYYDAWQKQNDERRFVRFEEDGFVYYEEV